MRIARVFPRKTRATPTDALAFWGPPGLFPPEIDCVHISVTFSWDLNLAEYYASTWQKIAPVEIGGPATGMRGEEFTPGLYLRHGYTITSRGCPERCWFCDVWKRDGNIRELTIHEGWNVLDDNLLACSEIHIRSIFSMLKRQTRKVEFSGGFQAERLQQWHVDLLVDLKPEQMFFAYDEERDYDPLVAASQMLREAGFNRKQMRCYCLIGYPKDTMDAAEKRLRQCLQLGFFPMAMLWRNRRGDRDPQWMSFQRQWARPASIYAMAK